MFAFLCSYLDHSVFVGFLNLGCFVLMAKIGSGFFYSLSVDPGSVCRRYKVFSLKPAKPNKFNQSKTTVLLLIKLGDEPSFFN